MSDQFPIIAPQVTASAGVVSDYVINLAFNQLTLAVRQALNTLAGSSFPPSGPAGGDLSGTYPNPTVLKVHATSGTIDNVVIGGVVPAAGTFTTLSATSLGLTNPLPVTSGGMGQAGLQAHVVLLGAGTSPVTGTAPGAAGQMLLSTGTTTDPAFGNNPTITGGSINNAPVGATTPSTGAFTTLTATTPVGVISGGTGRATLTSHGVLVGEGTAAVNQTTAGNTGQMLLGVTGADPTFGNNPTITGGSIDGTPVGGTTPSTGAFTTVTATGTITPSQTSGIVGTTTNNNANAGSVGEFVTATGSGVALTSGTAANITSISLTAGDWDVWGNIEFAPTGAAQTILIGGINTTSATQAATPFREVLQGTLTGNNSAWAPQQRISIAGTTTVFLVGTSTFSGGTVAATGYIAARRAR